MCVQVSISTEALEPHSHVLVKRGVIFFISVLFWDLETLLKVLLSNYAATCSYSCYDSRISQKADSTFRGNSKKEMFG